MTYLTGESSVIHDWTEIDFVNFVYNGVYFTGGTGTSLINGATITCVPGLNINVIINEENTLPDGRFLLLGNPKTKFTGSFSDVASDIYTSKYSFYFRGDNLQQKFRWENAEVPNVSSIIGSQTVSGWAKIDGDHITKDGFIIENYHSNGGFALGYDASSDVWRWKIDTDTTAAKIVDSTSKPTIDDAGIWTQVTGVWDAPNATLKIYINGIFENETIGVTGNRLASTQPLRIGAETPAGGEMKGDINNVVIWDEALSDEEVLENFNSGTPYNVLVEGPKIGNIVFWSKVGDDSNWDGTDWFIKDQVSGKKGTSSFSSTIMTYSSRVKDAP